MPSWFTELEEVTYSIVEFIPLVGTVYSLERAGIAYKEKDWLNHWQSVGNFLESSIRDVILVWGVTETATAVVLHTMAESFTDKMIDIYHRDHPEVKLNSTPPEVKDKGHVLVAESSEGKNRDLIFGGKAKGIHHFQGAVFTGSLIHPQYAPDGETIKMEIRRGLYDGARVTFTWKWTEDWDGAKNRPEATLGYIVLREGTPTRFGLSKRKGAGGWEGYDFWGSIKSKNQITATTRIGGVDFYIDFTRSSSSET